MFTKKEVISLIETIIEKVPHCEVCEKLGQNPPECPNSKDCECAARILELWEEKK